MPPSNAYTASFSSFTLQHILFSVQQFNSLKLFIYLLTFSLIYWLSSPPCCKLNGCQELFCPVTGQDIIIWHKTPQRLMVPLARSTKSRVFLVAQAVKNPPAMQETWVWSLGWEESLERERLPTPVFLAEDSHGQRSLAGYSSWGHKGSDMTEVT